MGFWGKLAGGVLGAAVLGPLGAGLGVALGHGLDSLDANSQNDVGNTSSNDLETELQLFENVVIMCAKMAAADGHVTKEEIKLLQDELFSEIIEEDAAQQAMELFDNAIHDPENISVYTGAVKALYDDYEFRKEISVLMFRIAQSDGFIHPKEIEMLYDIYGIMDLKEEDYNLLMNAALLNIQATLLGKIVHAKGRITLADTLHYKSCLSVSGITDRETIDSLSEVFYAAKDISCSFEDLLSSYENMLTDDEEVRENIYSFFRFAVSGSHPEQEALLERLAEQLGVSSHEDYEGISSLSLEVCCSVLQCSLDDSLESITESYRRLLKEYHPDYIQSKNLSEGFIEFANQQTSKIVEAFKTIKEHKASQG